jgi:hypothetical protein
VNFLYLLAADMLTREPDSPRLEEVSPVSSVPRDVGSSSPTVGERERLLLVLVMMAGGFSALLPGAGVIDGAALGANAGVGVTGPVDAGVGKRVFNMSKIWEETSLAMFSPSLGAMLGSSGLSPHGLP